MSESLMPFIWVAITLPILLVTQRWLHNHLRGIALLVTGKMSWAVILYALIFFPGVLLHEVSHWLAALLLGVKTGAISLIPRLKPDGSIQLGYVEYYKGKNLGPVREAAIGGAPLIAGTAVTLLIAFRIFSVTTLAAAIQSGEIDNFTLALGDIFTSDDFLVWLYLLFAVSNAMMPSASDRQAWPAFLWLMAGTAVVLYLLDLQELLWRGLAGPTATVFGYLGLAFSLALGLNLVMMMLLAAIEAIISRAKGVELIYSDVELPAGDRYNRT